MPSWQARVARALIRRRARAVLGDMSDVTRLRKALGAATPLPRGVHCTRDVLGGVPGEWVELADAADNAASSRSTLMYVHGGGFIACSPRTHRAITGAFALQGFRVFAPDYRLAPEHPFPAPLEDVLAAWRALRTSLDADMPANRVVMAGDSAGGTLALAAMLALRDAGERLPDAAALFSPAADLTWASESITGNRERDPLFHGPALANLARAYLGATGDATDPRASPLLGDLAGLPPLLLHVGAEEALRDDGLRLAVKARAAGVRVETSVWPVVTHGWQLLPALPEARRSLARAGEFLKTATRDEIEHLDAVIVGAGLSGIGAAVHLQNDLPGRRFAILESRGAIGGTWDLFRYPGVRSDSDMFTLGYAFRPWTDSTSLADGASIRRYIVETAVEHGLDRQVRFGHKVVRADWSSADARWTLEIEHAPDDGRPRRSRISCSFLLACSGYYRYSKGYAPEFAGSADFAGRLVHPQSWPQDLACAGQRIVVIGSGATAVTLVPELARTAAYVTMLQRSPSYVLALPARDRLAQALRRWLPPAMAYRLTRAKNIAVSTLMFQFARRWPERTRKALVGMARRALGPAHDVDTHFTPRYDPWDQRLCIAPDGDLFRAIKDGRAEVVTDEIERLTTTGIRLASGRELPADIVVSATGLVLNLLGDVAFAIDGAPVDFSKVLSYRGMMFSGVPNLVNTVGYTNASWTLKAGLTARYASRLLAYMDKHGLAATTPVPDPRMPTRPLLDLTSGYVQRVIAHMPRQGTTGPWRVRQNYLLDWLALRCARIADGSLRFKRR